MAKTRARNTWRMKGKDICFFIFKNEILRIINLFLFAESIKKKIANLRILKFKDLNRETSE